MSHHMLGVLSGLLALLASNGASLVAGGYLVYRCPKWVDRIEKLALRLLGLLKRPAA